MRHAPAVNVVGYLRSESGVGTAARVIVRALDAAGVAVLPVHPQDVPPSRQGSPFRTITPERAAFGTNLLCITAYETPGFAESVAATFFDGRHTIGLWWWEVDVFPDFMWAGFDSVDEVWVGSEHIARAIRPAAGSVPVNVIRVPVVKPRSTRLTREELGLPQGFLFVTTFGYYSSVVRKNPMGTIEAFAEAFAPGEGAALVVKAIDHHAHPEEHARLEQLAAEHPDVHLLPGYLDDDEMDALIGLSDAVVSLHRAEGFGFTPAVGMALGKPVIATRYSGNLDYMTDENSFLVDAELVPIGSGGAPYPAEGQWADPDLNHAAQLMRNVFEDRTEAGARGGRAARDMADRHSPAAAGSLMRTLLEEHSTQTRLHAGARTRAWWMRRGRG